MTNILQNCANHKFLFSLIYIFIGVSFSFGQTTSLAEFPNIDDGLLWKVEGNNIQGDVYVFGTMHLISKESFIFPKSLEKKLRKSDQLIMELAGLPDQSTTMEMITLKEGTLFDYFDEKQKDSVLNWAEESLHMTEETFTQAMSKMKPLAIVQIAIQIQFLGKSESYELNFEAIAQDNDIEILGLETAKEQMALFDNLTDEQQTEMVMETVRDQDKSIAKIHEMQEIYVQQNVDKLFEFIQNDGGIVQQEQNAFLDERNKKWLDKLIVLFGDKNMFIAVGAGHLGGPEGLLRLLDNKGYKLTPIQL